MKTAWFVFGGIALFGATLIAQTPSSAVDQEDAYVQASILFHSVLGCGGVDASGRDAGDHWEFTAKEGYVPVPDPNPIMVDKKTGWASWATADRLRREAERRHLESR